MTTKPQPELPKDTSKGDGPSFGPIMAGACLATSVASLLTLIAVSERTTAYHVATLAFAVSIPPLSASILHFEYVRRFRQPHNSRSMLFIAMVGLLCTAVGLGSLFANIHQSYCAAFVVAVFISAALLRRAIDKIDRAVKHEQKGAKKDLN